MDKSVSDFNIRLRTIKIREAAVGIFISFIIALALMVVFPELYYNDDLFLIILILLILLFFAWALRGTHGLGKNFEQVFQPNIRNEILYVFAINIIFAFIFTCFVGWADLFIGFTDPNWVTGFDIDSVDISSGAFLLSAIEAMIFAPLLEELIFRGVLISSFLFAVGHDFGGMTSAFLFGMCMCILYLKTDNILVPMSVHFINNVVATFLELTQIDIIVGQLPWLLPTTIIVLITTILLVKYIVQESITLKNRFG